MEIYVLQVAPIKKPEKIKEVAVYFKEPTLEQLKVDLRGFGGIEDENILKLLSKKHAFNTALSKFSLYKLSIPNKKLLANMDEELNVLLYVDGTDLGVNIETIFRGPIKKHKINKNALQDIEDFYCYPKMNTEEETLAKVMTDFLNGEDVYVDDFDKKFQWATWNTKDIK